MLGASKERSLHEVEAAENSLSLALVVPEVPGCYTQGWLKPWFQGRQVGFLSVEVMLKEGIEGALLSTGCWPASQFSPIGAVGGKASDFQKSMTPSLTHRVPRHP